MLRTPLSETVRSTTTQTALITPPRRPIHAKSSRRPLPIRSELPAVYHLACSRTKQHPVHQHPVHLAGLPSTSIATASIHILSFPNPYATDRRTAMPPGNNMVTGIICIVLACWQFPWLAGVVVPEQVEVV
ncbi:hypothetical protein B0H12DRAFT_1247032 [Mycena haematopus]|nr:hypothetical protein B0H12DRAFT_1247032 [Mycena haematopus]